MAIILDDQSLALFEWLRTASDLMQALHLDSGMKRQPKQLCKSKATYTMQWILIQGLFTGIPRGPQGTLGLQGTARASEEQRGLRVPNPDPLTASGTSEGQLMARYEASEANLAPSWRL